MEKNEEINFSLVLLISFFIHIVVSIGFFFPIYNESLRIGKYRGKSSTSRDIIVNINQDRKKVETRTTLLSDKDSSARGYITRTKGDHWLNNYRDFALLKGSRGQSRLSKNSMSRCSTAWRGRTEGHWRG